LRTILKVKELEYLENARVARLATSDRKGTIGLVPIVYATKKESIYFVVDKKKKRSGKMLRRLRNISENPNVTLLVDNYSENWDELSYLMLVCTAKIVLGTVEKKLAASLLTEKYEQYETGGYFPGNLEEAIIVKLQPKRAIFWQNLHPSLV
jgi:PPOX class probable F420-dependent enzyme